MLRGSVKDLLLAFDKGKPWRKVRQRYNTPTASCSSLFYQQPVTCSSSLPVLMSCSVMSSRHCSGMLYLEERDAYKIEHTFGG